MAVNGEEPSPDATLADLVVQLQRIADALAPKDTTCGETDGNTPCVLDVDHIGYHVTADGRHWWLEA